MSTPTPNAPDPTLPDRLAAIERIAADVAHDLRTPLQSLFINLEVLRRRVQNGAHDDALQRTDVVEDEVRRIAALLEALMIVLSPGRSAQTFDLAAAVQRIMPLLQSLARARRLQLTSHIDSVLVRAPEDRLLYALVRATAAACDALSNGGTVNISTAGADAGIDIHVQADVSDDGTADAAPLEAARAGLPQFLAPTDGTIRLAVGSPSQPRNCLSLRVARAGPSLTGASG